MWRPAVIFCCCLYVASCGRAGGGPGHAPYTYRLLSPAPAPISRTSRHYDTGERLGPGPYLQKDDFFHSGFLEDLLGVGPSKRELHSRPPPRHQSVFPSFFTPSHRLSDPPLPKPSRGTASGGPTAQAALLHFSVDASPCSPWIYLTHQQ